MRRARYVAQACTVRETEAPPQLLGPEQVAAAFRDLVPEAETEHFVVFALNARGVPLSSRVVSVGSLNASIVHPREVFVHAVRERACSLIVAHNHPSGDPTPSEEDVAITRRLIEAGHLLGIEVLDHVVIGGRGYVSHRERRLGGYR